MGKVVYLAGGFFNLNQIDIIDNLEIMLEEIGELEVYSPRRDGTKLTPNEFGNTEVRRKVFQDNVDNIKNADFLIASLDSQDGVLDTGTVWEVGMATALGIPVYGFRLTEEDIMGGISSSITKWSIGYDELEFDIREEAMNLPKKEHESPERTESKSKVLLIGPDNTEKHDIVNLDILAVLNSKGVHTRLVDRPSTVSIGDHADEIFNGIDYMVAVVDDRHPAIAWSMGQAYIRNIPIISFTNHDYGINLMLLLSIVRHVKGTKTLLEFVEEIQSVGGISNVEKVDYADVKAI